MDKLPYIVYFAASLFNGRECYFNVHLAKLLEARFKEVYLPQRDGFEFSKLTDSLACFFPQQEAENAGKHVIDAYDIGRTLPKTDVVVADLGRAVERNPCGF